MSGLIGSGRTELGKCLFGLTKADEGHVSIDGRKWLIVVRPIQLETVWFTCRRNVRKKAFFHS